jgi:hypothetical protein
MNMRNEERVAKGSFAITMRPPQPPYDTAGDVSLGRMTIDKQFLGDLEATSIVEMTTCMGAHGSGGYVALERVTGTLQGRPGTFVLQHSGTMTAGQAQMSVTITPDSGTGELQGISGGMTIDIVEGKHFYTLQYSLAE